MDRSQSGIDNVPSIHCPFWPDSAKEWRTRPRQFAWPSPSDVKSIVDFGFHLAPVGHLSSDMSMIEWRILFSVAERTLVWSFNHVQIQCYAVMKIILKEFIKTFLFWKYEETDPSFWCHENLRECILLLLSGLRESILRRSLKHYFIPGSNLLSVKLTPIVCGEIVRTIDIMLQSNISMMKECNTLKHVWDQFVNTDPGIGDCVLRRKGNMGKTYACLMELIMLLNTWTSIIHQSDLLSIIFYHIVFHSLQNIRSTCFISLVLRVLVFQVSKSVLGKYRAKSGNKTLYRRCRYLHLNVYGFDISTCRL